VLLQSRLLLEEDERVGELHLLVPFNEVR